MAAFYSFAVSSPSFGSLLAPIISLPRVGVIDCVDMFIVISLVGTYIFIFV